MVTYGTTHDTGNIHTACS